jgi:hypothetical protein
MRHNTAMSLDQQIDITRGLGSAYRRPEHLQPADAEIAAGLKHLILVAKDEHQHLPFR